MSARDAMAAMLDELMGSKRNLDIGTDITVTYDDPHICRYYIAGYCPHEMFVNTKADLGACPKIHDDRLRLEYPTSSSFEKMGFEQDFLRFLIRLEEDNQRRIKRNKEKLGHTDMMAQKREDERVAGIKSELSLVEADIERVMKATEEAGARNDVTTTLALVKQSEVLEQSKQALILKMETPPDVAFSIAPALAPMLQEAENRQKDVCDVCGSMLIRNDAQVRVEEHLMGKMHMGFAKIQVTIKELKERFRKQSEDKEKERDEKRKKREGDRGSDRDRSERRDRDKDRGSRGGRDHRHRSRSRDRRDRSRERRSDHRRGDDRRNRR